jgi:hypothetical protein
VRIPGPGQHAAACCGTLGQIEGVLHKLDRDADGQSWDKLNEDIERALRNFHVAAREELGVEEAAQRQGQANGEPI